MLLRLPFAFRLACLLFLFPVYVFPLSYPPFMFSAEFAISMKPVAVELAPIANTSAPAIATGPPAIARVPPLETVIVVPAAIIVAPPAISPFPAITSVEPAATAILSLQPKIPHPDLYSSPDCYCRKHTAKCCSTCPRAGRA